MTKQKLDETMNKECFVLKIKLSSKNKKGKSIKKKYFGYIYPTDNWVEVHCFKDINFKTKKYDVDYSYMSVEQDYIIKNGNRPSRMKSKWGIFGERVYSFIIPRNKVCGNKKTIECEPLEEDFERWSGWHQDDDYDQEVWIEDIECSWVESHMGNGFLHYFNIKSGKERMYPIVK